MKVIFKTTTIVTGLLAFTLMAGCATHSVRVQPMASSDQKTLWINGSEAIVSSGKSLVIMRPANTNYSAKERQKFIVYVENKTESPALLSTDGISASINADSLKVFTYNELAAEIESARKNQAIAAAIGGLGKSISASKYAGRQSYSGVYTDNYGGQGNFTGYSYDRREAQRAQHDIQQETDQEMSLVNTSSKEALSRLNLSALMTNTVFPGQSYGGVVEIQPPRIVNSPATMIIKVQFAGEEHLFNFSQRMVTK